MSFRKLEEEPTWGLDVNQECYVKMALSAYTVFEIITVAFIRIPSTSAQKSTCSPRKINYKICPYILDRTTCLTSYDTREWSLGGARDGEPCVWSEQCGKQCVWKLNGLCLSCVPMTNALRSDCDFEDCLEDNIPAVEIYQIVLIVFGVILAVSVGCFFLHQDK